MSFRTEIPCVVDTVCDVTLVLKDLAARPIFRYRFEAINTTGDCGLLIILLSALTEKPDSRSFLMIALYGQLD